MKSINFPTIIVKLRTGNLKKSTMYYVILEIETEEVVPAIMFSNPHCHRKTKLAELLPLSFEKISKSIVRSTAMMGKKRCRNVIHKGLSYKVISLIPGRGIHGHREYSWNKYDIRNTDLRNVLIRRLEKDINQMSILLAKEIFPFQGTIAPHNSMQKNLTLRQKTFGPTWTVEREKEENLHDRGSVRSKVSTNKVVCKPFNGCTFQIPLNAVNPNEHNGELYIHFSGGSLSRTSVDHLNELAKYNCFSDII